ncbi:hypothetical protein GFGA_1c0921 [Gluconobacter frateurii NBRC 103465]|nr:hypothetical protein GFGA_1c0921 [Gluconobacter frateurii NBRC 103465]
MSDNLGSIIPPAAEAERRDGNPKEAKDIQLLSGEFQQFEADNQSYRNERAQIENRKAKIEIAMMRLDLRMKNKFSKNVFSYLWFFSGFCGIILFLQGTNPNFDIGFIIKNHKYLHVRMHGFKLSETALTTLIGSTAASAIGLVAIVLRGLFRSTIDDTSKKNSESKKD